MPALDQLANVARPDLEEEDLTILESIRNMIQMTKDLLAQSNSGMVEDVLASVLQKLVGLSRKIDDASAPEEG